MWLEIQRLHWQSSSISWISFWLLCLFSHCHTKRNVDARAVFSWSLLHVENQWMVGLKLRKNWKMVGSIYWKSRCNFIYDKIRFLRWISWKCINSYRNIFWNADWRTWGSLVPEMLQNIQDFKRAAVSFLIKTQEKRSIRLLHLNVNWKT